MLFHSITYRYCSKNIRFLLTISIQFLSVTGNRRESSTTKSILKRREVLNRITRTCTATGLSVCSCRGCIGSLKSLSISIKYIQLLPSFHKREMPVLELNSQILWTSVSLLWDYLFCFASLNRQLAFDVTSHFRD